MNDALLPWHAEAWSRFAAAHRADRLPHALLLTGAAGTGKRLFAQRLAARLLCRGDAAIAPCGQCSPCRQIGAGAHPGLTVVEREPERRDIGVDAIRDLCARLAMTSHDGSAKIAIIDPADAVSISGVNALLKTLEEPPAGSLMLLLSERPLSLPATLRSRCQRLRLPLPDAAVAAEWLAARFPEQSPADRAAALEVTRGAALRAAALLETPEQLQRYRQWHTALERLLTGRAGPLQTAGEIARDDVPSFLQWLPAWVIEQQRDAATPVQRRTLSDVGQGAVDALRRLQRNANPQLLVEAVLIDAARRLAPTRSSR